MIAYETSPEGLVEADLAGFFVGWPRPPSPERHLSVLRGSEFVVVARDGETGPVVGVVTAVGDGVLSAFIPHLEVLPEYQGRGIGTELVRRILALLAGTYMVDLCCDEELVAFYERFGMSRWVGMGIRNREALVEQCAAGAALGRARSHPQTPPGDPRVPCNSAEGVIALYVERMRRALSEPLAVVA